MPYRSEILTIFLFQLLYMPYRSEILTIFLFQLLCMPYRYEIHVPMVRSKTVKATAKRAPPIWVRVAQLTATVTEQEVDTAAKTVSTLRKHVRAIYCNISRLKNDYFQMKKCNIFLIFAQNIDCGYTLEPPLSLIYVLEQT